MNENLGIYRTLDNISKPGKKDYLVSKLILPIPLLALL